MGARFFDVCYRFTYLRSMGAEKNPRLLSQTYQSTCSYFLSDIVYLIYIYIPIPNKKSPLRKVQPRWDMQGQLFW